MRLLDTKTIVLDEFIGTNIPPYVILSHTWGQNEVSFQEMQPMLHLDAKVKAGYEKIYQCCQMAALYGFQYAWVDTCCIDKTSSAELSEAINSMYRWYRFAEVCYVYLEDVPSGLSQAALEEKIKESRWFARGWTLQELIAPPSLTFFDNQWNELGTKESLSTLISEITKIPKEVLQDADKLQEFSVAQKMSWASKRETTRIEDIAYCLLGIFGVNMPMLYGEGESAFIRLQEEIIAKTHDHSIISWTSDSYFSDGLLATTPAQFASCGEIIHCKDLAITSFLLTNRGLHLNLRLKTWKKSKLCLAVLDCRLYKGNEKYLGIYLERKSESSDIFKRVWSNEMGDIDDIEVSDLKYENVFVKQDSAFSTFSDYTHYGVIAKGLGLDQIVLQESSPPFPDGQTDFLDLYCSSGYKAIAAFRFQDATGDGFFLFIKTSQEVLAPTMYRSCLSAMIHEVTDKLTFYPLGELCWKLESDPIFLGEVWQGENSDRFRWRHPRKEYWIKVVIRRQLSGNKRWKSITLTTDHASARTLT